MKSTIYVYQDRYYRIDQDNRFNSLRSAAVDAELLPQSPATLADRTDKTQPQENTNMNITEFLVAFIAALNNIAEAIRGNAGAPSNIIAGPGAKAETPAKPTATGGGNTAGLEKARAAAAAKKAAEKAAAEAAAAEQADLDLLGGGEAASEVTLEMLRNKGMEILKAKKQPQMKELLDGLGAASITVLAEDKYAEAYEGLEAILSL